MFCSLDHRDCIIIFRGLLILSIIILLGVGVAEQQLNGLTQRQENVLAFSVTYNQNGIYTIYIGGYSYKMSAVYTAGEIINKDRTIIVKTTQHYVVIPKYIELNCKEELALLAFYVKVIQEKFNVYSQALR